MPAIIYQVCDVITGEDIGTVTGTELRVAAGRMPQSPVFNSQLVEEYNTSMERINAPERIRSMIRR